MLILLNHAFTPDQTADVASWGETNFAYPSGHIARLWANINPQADSLADGLLSVYQWLVESRSEHNTIVVQGEPGATFIVVQWAFGLGYTPLYATTTRHTIETPQSDGSVKVERTFKHSRFRKYERININPF